jgi:hypothetical protein
MSDRRVEPSLRNLGHGPTAVVRGDAEPAG